MAFLEDAIDLITAEISHIGLSKDGSNEMPASNGYAKQVPTYGAASAGKADLIAPLEFNGPANDGPVTHLIFFKDGSPWVIRPVDEAESFNSDGRLDVSSAPVTAAFPS